MRHFVFPRFFPFSSSVVPSDFKKASRFSQIYAQNEIYDINNHEPFDYILKHLHRNTFHKHFTSLEITLAYFYLQLPNYRHQVFQKLLYLSFLLHTLV